MEQLPLQDLAKQQVKEIIQELTVISDELGIDIFDEIEHKDVLGMSFDDVGKIIDAGKYAIGKYNEIVNKGGILNDNGRQVVIDEINKMKGVFKTSRNTNSSKGNNGGGNNGGGSSRPSIYDYTGGARPVNVQAAGSNPIDVKFETPIKVRTYGDIDLASDTDIYKFPVIFTRQILDFSQFYKQSVDPYGHLNPGVDAIMASYVNSILNDMNNIVQENVSYSTIFTYKEVANWLSVLCECLNAYYGIYSIIQFEMEPMNKNEGMEWLRRNMTPSDFNILDIFVRDLMSVPMPPRLPQVFYMLNANYRFEELPKSPIIKITSADVKADGKLDFGLVDLLDKLNTDELRNTVRKIVRGVPGYIRPNVPMYGPETYHSRNFNTIFINSGHVRRTSIDNKYAYHPTVDSRDNDYLTKDAYYVSNTNDLDGLTTALYCAWDTATPQSDQEDIKPWITGLFKPKTFTEFEDNRCVFFGGKLKKLDPDLKHEIPFIHEINDQGLGKTVGFGVNVEQIYGLSLVSLRETSKEFVDWLFDLESMFNTRKSDKPQKRRSRGKKKSKKTTSKSNSKLEETEE